MSWNAPDCPTCKAKRTLFRAASSVANVYWWCTACDDLFSTGYIFGVSSMDGWSTKNLDTKVVAAKGELDGLCFAMRLEQDGTVRLKLGANGAEFHCTMGHLQALSRAASDIAHEAERRQEHLRGADVWVFRRDGTKFYASLDGSEGEIVPWTSGGRRAHPRDGSYRRAEQECSDCVCELPKGTLGFRFAEPRPYRFSSEIRFCQRCVEGAPTADRSGSTGARRNFLVIAGGKSAAK
jgi:hypothetical protein